MHRFANLRALVVAAVTSVTSVTASACCGDLADRVESRAVAIDPEAAKWADAVDRCLADDLDCVELCLRTLEPESVADLGEPMFDECRYMDQRSGGGEAQVVSTYRWPLDCSAGRRPRGATTAGARLADPVARWLATMAALEAASVVAFVELAADLTVLGAPAALIERCRAAARDEVRHAAIMATLARRAGARTATSAAASSRGRASLFAVARHNAVEGCVRETYGAALALWQARHAADPDVRAALGAIAGDEIEHAQLSRDLDAWLRPRLRPEALLAIDEAAAAAARALRESPSAPPELRRRLGLPGPAEVGALLAALGL